MTQPIRFDNSYARLPGRFYAPVAPTPVRAPRLIEVNRDLAGELGIDADWLAGPAGLAMVAGNALPDGAEPIALAYAGHQFGHFVPQLGDGRAILIGEVVDREGRRRDIQLKGSGPTPFSRRGDGRAALGPVIREYVVSEAMAALGIPTTRALMAVSTGEPVYREDILPGAVLARVAASHIRVGTFEYFSARGDVDALRALVDTAIARHDPDLAGHPHAALALLERVVARQADLVAAWMLVGFVHGVMNTDNTAISGETIDYGPCAFLDAYHPATTFSSIDRQGRYAYANQPRAAHWNLCRLAETLLALIDPDEPAAVRAAEDVLATFPARVDRALLDGFRRKLGLAVALDEDAPLVRDLLAALAGNQVDFTLFFRRLSDLVAGADAEPVRSLFVDPTRFDAWADGWRARLAREPARADAAERMRRVNPAVIARNHRVEEAIRAAVDRDDLGPMRTLLSVLRSPYAEHPAGAALAVAPEPHERVLQTFCGT